MWKHLRGIPGIGPKSAKRIILELKDKIKAQQEVENIKNQIENNNKSNTKIQKAIENNEKIDETIAALQVLGYNKKEIERVLDKLDIKEMTTEELIKKGLNLLSI